MDEEKFQRAIDIILQNQAQFYADLQQMQETNKEIQEANKELQEVQKEGEKRTNELGLACLNLYNTSVEHQSAIEEQSKNTAELTQDIRELREAQKETDERLNAVIFMAEKFFGGKNGKSK